MLCPRSSGVLAEEESRNIALLFAGNEAMCFSRGEERSYWSSEEFGTKRDKTVGGYSALVMRMYNCKTYFKSKDSYYYVRAVAQFY